jgi:putative transcriptional regulator
MIEILRNKNLTTRFQILVEVANSGPNVQQRDIARKLDITPQAVSDYIAQLIKEGMLISEGRSVYRVTNEGVNWIIKALKELGSYSTFIEKAITNISVCTAIAECKLRKGQKVGLGVKGGLLFATNQLSEGATGIAITSANEDEDVGITNIEGIVSLQIGRVTILRMPDIQDGGSRKVNLNRLQREAKDRPFIGAIGIESYVALRKSDIRFYMYGSIEAAIEAAKSGLNPLVVCVENETSALITRLEEEKISYELFDLTND